MVHIHEVRVGPSWMDPIVRFLKDDIMPKEKSEAEKIQINAHRFWLSEDHKLYKRFYSGPYLLCIHPEASKLLLEKLHEGIYGESHKRKGSVGVTQEEDLCHTEPLPRDIGGWECKRKPWNMLKNVTSAKGLPQISISQKRSSTLRPVHGRSPNRVGIL